MNAPTLAQVAIVAPPQESIWHYLAEVPFTMEAQIFYGLLIGALIGMLGHYLRAWTSGELAGGLIDYLFRDNPRRSALAMFSVVTWCLGEVSTGLFATETGQFVGWGLVLLSGIKTGYAGDSLLKKGNRQAWTDEQRTEKARKP